MVAGFTGSNSVRFSAKLDSKGRITIPARIRNKLDLTKGKRISLSLESTEVIRKEFGSEEEALKFISGLEGVNKFSFDGEFLEVVLDE